MQPKLRYLSDQERLQPDACIINDSIVLANERGSDCAPALLLTTSGSTSANKYVKLSYKNLQANCDAIRNSLPIGENDVACLLLSPSYSYGLSIVNTHLSAGACLYVPNDASLARSFWQNVNDVGVTSIGFVPSHLEALAGRDLKKFVPKSLRYITVAGGRVTTLGYDVLKQFRALGVKVYVMYGQTEATARLTCLPDEMFDEKYGSVGKSIDGMLSIDGGEVIYEGENVFSGYATSRDDLFTCDRAKMLRTGDLGCIDGDGYVWITGRMKRIAKVNSQRISLDELEVDLEKYMNLPVKCVSDDDRIYAFTTQKAIVDMQQFCASDNIRKHIVFKLVDNFPLLTSGKVDYVALGSMMDG
jgi:long-subunit acyl-CoA synthetase (AMP-forming)